MRLITLIASILISTSSLADAQGTANPPRFRLAGATIQLPPDITQGTVDVVVLATLTEDHIQEGAEATLADETPSLAGTSVTATPVKTTTETQQVWRFAVTVKGLGRAESQSRVFVVSYGKLRERLEYTLSNTTTKTFTWSVKTAGEWNLGSMKSLSIPITVGDVAATNVVLHQVALASEDKMKRTLGTEQFQLCDKPDAGCATPLSLAARKPHTLYVRPIGALPAGNYKGNILIAAAEKTDPEVLAVTVYSPLPAGQLRGFAALFLGVLMSFFLQVFVRAWIQRRQDKAAIALLKKRLQQVVLEFEQLDTTIKTAAVEWKQRATRALSDMAELDDLARGIVPQPFADEVTTVETLKQGLDRHSKGVMLLRTLLRDGLLAVDVVRRQFPGNVKAIETAAGDVAAISAAEDANSRITAILDTLRNSVGLKQLFTTQNRTAAEEFQSLQLQIAALSLLVWTAWAVISVLTGALLLIYQNPGFGTEFDLLSCVMWGLGVTVAGQQASQIGPANVAQSIGIKLPGR